jgi:superfamily II DNA/RNA helicase
MFAGSHFQPEKKTLIFVETKRKADELTFQMRRDGWPALCIHGDKTQAERDWVMKEFREGRVPIMLATDVASRGLGGFLTNVWLQPPIPHFGTLQM